MKKQIVSMKRGAQKGFTLIELMIVIAIIGVLAAFAIPQFQDYTVRTRVAEGLVLAATAKNLVTDNIINGNADLESGYTFPGETKNTNLIEIDDASGEITITSNWPKDTPVVMTLTPGVWTDSTTFEAHSSTPITESDIIGWQCSSSHANQNQIPAECRN